MAVVMGCALTIHPTAVVDPQAVLEEGVSIGPYAVIESGARIGAGSSIGAHAVVTGHATIGRDCRIHYGAVVGNDPQDLAFEGGPTRVVIGDRTVLREYATVHRATKPGVPTRVGADCLLMVNSHVAHDCVLEDQVVVCNGALVAGHVQVGRQSFLSGNTVIHQFSRIGRLVMLSGLSGVGRNVGPFLTIAGRCKVVGINSVGLRRAGFDGASRLRVREAYLLLFQAETLQEGLERLGPMALEHDEVRAIMEFHRHSQRGFTRPSSHAGFDVRADL